eukprot:Rhum_TRINITY_DN12877_c0_g1::Rhum_TRINITY_DN12877_c0_g1_i1::g.55026::m.55026
MHRAHLKPVHRLVVEPTRRHHHRRPRRLAAAQRRAQEGLHTAHAAPPVQSLLKHVQLLQPFPHILAARHRVERRDEAHNVRQLRRQRAAGVRPQPPRHRDAAVRKDLPGHDAGRNAQRVRDVERRLRGARVGDHLQELLRERAEARRHDARVLHRPVHADVAVQHSHALLGTQVVHGPRSAVPPDRRHSLKVVHPRLPPVPVGCLALLLLRIRLQPHLGVSGQRPCLQKRRLLHVPTPQLRAHQHFPLWKYPTVQLRHLRAQQRFVLSGSVVLCLGQRARPLRSWRLRWSYSPLCPPALVADACVRCGHGRLRLRRAVRRRNALRAVVAVGARRLILRRTLHVRATRGASPMKYRYCSF